jgi:hypothetical protein
VPCQPAGGDGLAGDEWLPHGAHGESVPIATDSGASVLRRRPGRAMTGRSAGNDPLTAPSVKFWRRHEARRQGFTLVASPRS